VRSGAPRPVHRLVIDTNVIVSGLMGGKPGAVLGHWSAGRVVMCVTDGVVDEYLTVLSRFASLRVAADDFLARVSDGQNVLWVEPTVALHVIETDPADDRFIECAVAAEADAIVSGDRHLLALGSFRGIPILTPAAFLEVLAGGDA
jgi:uncharacterized protein